MGALPLTMQEICNWTRLGALLPYPCYMLVLCACHMSPSHFSEEDYTHEWCTSLDRIWTACMLFSGQLITLELWVCGIHTL